MAFVQLPLPQIPYIRQDLTPTKEFYDWLKALDAIVRRLSGAVDFTPELQGSTSNPTVTGTLLGTYQVTGSFVVFALKLDISTISGGSGDARISLPIPSLSAFDAACAIFVSGMDWGVGRVTPAALVTAGQQYVSIISELHDATNTPITIADFSNGDMIAVSGCYRWKA